MCLDPQSFSCAFYLKEERKYGGFDTIRFGSQDPKLNRIGYGQCGVIIVIERPRRLFAASAAQRHEKINLPLFFGAHNAGFQLSTIIL